MNKNKIDDLILTIKNNPIIAVIVVAFVIGLGVFFYLSQQGTQVALDKCIDSNINANKNNNLSEDYIITTCIRKHQVKIPLNTIKFSTKDDYKVEYNNKCVENKITDKEELKRYKLDGIKGNVQRFIINYSGKYPECSTRKKIGITNSLLNRETSKYIVTQIIFESGEEINTALYPGNIEKVSNKNLVLKSLKGIKIKLK